ncbi:MAG: hypothetical protein JST04_11230 [Bdellovibrionales bacterium]|nr:hypothetical protein [Bdellovibrionales bacterium]
MVTKRARIALLAALALAASGCGKFGKSSESTDGGPYLYVASGATYAGNGITPSTASNTIVRYTLDGTFDKVVYDFNANPGDQPAAMIDYDDESLLVLVENAGGGRRVDRVMKDGSSDSVFISSSYVTGAIVRALIPTFDGGWLISRTGLIEKFNSARVRTPSTGVAAWVNAPAGSCATSTTLIPAVVESDQGNIIYAHAATSQNRIGMIKKTGYLAAADCITATSAPTANHFPTTMLMHSVSGKLLVAFGNNTGGIHEIYPYTVTSTTITAGSSAYNNPSVLAGISSMAELPDGTIAVASALSTMNTVERFSVDSSTGALTRIGTHYILPSVYTRSVSAMLVGN